MNYIEAYRLQRKQKTNFICSTYNKSLITKLFSEYCYSVMENKNNWLELELEFEHSIYIST